MTAELQWKIEDGQLMVLWKRSKAPDKWCLATPMEAATVVLSTQEKCAQVAANYEGDSSEGKYQQRQSIAFAIRAVKMMET